MKSKFRFLSLLSRLGENRHASSRGLLIRLLRDEAGSYLLYMTLVVPILVGVAGLASEGAWWLYIHQTLQNAADSAALSAAANMSKGLDAGHTTATITTQATTQANAITSAYCAVTGNSNSCFVNGQNNVTVTVNPLPTNNPPSVEVTVAQVQSLLFSSIWLSTSKSISTSAVAILNNNTKNCILALAPTGKGIYTQFKNGKATVNNLSIQLTGCSLFANSSSSNAFDIEGNNNNIAASAIGAAGTGPGVFWSGNNDPFGTTPTSSGAPAIPDPYATPAKTWPATCSGSSCTIQSASCSPQCGSNTTISPGVYPSGIDFNSNNTTYTMQPGVYYLAGDFNMSGQHMLVNANNVTFVMTGNSNFTESSNNADINLTAPTTGWSAGVAIWAPTSNGTIALTLGNSSVANIDGVVYTPNAEVQYDGNTASTFCTQIVASAVRFGGNSGGFAGNCNLPGVGLFGRAAALVE